MKHYLCLIIFLSFSCDKQDNYNPVSNVDIPIFEQNQENLSTSPNDQTGLTLDNYFPGQSFLIYREASDFQRLMGDRTVENLDINKCYMSRFFDNDTLSKQVTENHWLLKTSNYEFLVEICLDKVVDIKRVSFYSIISDSKDSLLVHQGSIYTPKKEGVRVFGLRNKVVCNTESLYRKRDIEHFAVIETLDGKMEKTDSVFLSNIENDSCF